MPNRANILRVLIEEIGGKSKLGQFTIWGKKKRVDYVEIPSPPGHNRPVLVLVENRPATMNDESFLHDLMLLRMKLERANQGKDVIIYGIVESKLIAELEKRAGMAFVVQSILGLGFGLFVVSGERLHYAEHGHGPTYDIERGGILEYGYRDKVDALSDRISRLVVTAVESRLK